MILFLDFDGTTHPIPCKDRDFFSCLPRLENVLREYPHVQVVISSLWRCDQPLEQLREYFSDDIRPRVIGLTPFVEAAKNESWSAFFTAKTRHAEILEWIAQHDYKGPWVALDDAWREFPDACLQLIRCYTEVGFDTAAEQHLRAYLDAYER